MPHRSKIDFDGHTGTMLTQKIPVQVFNGFLNELSRQPGKEKIADDYRCVSVDAAILKRQLNQKELLAKLGSGALDVKQESEVKEQLEYVPIEEVPDFNKLIPVYRKQGVKRVFIPFRRHGHFVGFILDLEANKFYYCDPLGHGVFNEGTYGTDPETGKKDMLWCPEIYSLLSSFKKNNLNLGKVKVPGLNPAIHRGSVAPAIPPIQLTTNGTDCGHLVALIFQWSVMMDCDLLSLPGQPLSASSTDNEVGSDDAAEEQKEEKRAPDLSQLLAALPLSPDQHNAVLRLSHIYYSHQAYYKHDSGRYETVGHLDHEEVCFPGDSLIAYYLKEVVGLDDEAVLLASAYNQVLQNKFIVNDEQILFHRSTQFLYLLLTNPRVLIQILKECEALPSILNKVSSRELFTMIHTATTAPAEVVPASEQLAQQEEKKVAGEPLQVKRPVMEEVSRFLEKFYDQLQRIFPANVHSFERMHQLSEDQEAMIELQKWFGTEDLNAQLHMDLLVAGLKSALICANRATANLCKLRYQVMAGGIIKQFFEYFNKKSDTRCEFTKRQFEAQVERMKPLFTEKRFPELEAAFAQVDQIKTFMHSIRNRLPRLRQERCVVDFLGESRDLEALLPMAAFAKAIGDEGRALYVNHRVGEGNYSPFKATLNLTRHDRTINPKDRLAVEARKGLIENEVDRDAEYARQLHDKEIEEARRERAAAKQRHNTHTLWKPQQQSMSAGRKSGWHSAGNSKSQPLSAHQLYPLQSEDEGDINKGCLETGLVFFSVVSGIVSGMVTHSLLIGGAVGVLMLIVGLALKELFDWVSKSDCFSGVFEQPASYLQVK